MSLSCAVRDRSEIRALKDQDIAEGDIAVVSLRGMMYPGNIMHAKELGGCGEKWKR